MTSTMIIDNYGNQVWRNAEGQIHRVDGPAIIYANGTQKWVINGNLHRSDGPAVILSNGRQSWYIDDKRHRLDGPAIMRPDGSEEWWVDDNHVDQAFISQYIKHNPPTPKEQKLLMDFWGEGSS